MQFQRAFAQAFGTETRIAEVVFGLVLLAMVVAFAGSRWRRRRGKSSSERAEHNPLELTYLAVLVVVVGFLVFVSFSTNARYWRDPPPDMTVKVTAFQWCWDFQYPGTQVNVSARCEGGGPSTLVLPAGRQVRVELTSRDVIHSFWVPGLRLKLDIFPDHVNSFTVTLRDGRWVGHCAEFCGLYHAEMMFHLRAIPPAQFDRWLHARGGPVQEVSPR
jgi:cytochrome c oxidase subunit 2